MSLWYDKKGKAYASKGTSSWVKYYAEHLFSALTARLEGHFAGSEGKHKAEDILYEGTRTVRDTLDAKVDKAEGLGLSECDYTAAEKEKLAGVSPKASAVGLSLSSTGAEAFNDYGNTANIPYAHLEGRSNAATLRTFLITGYTENTVTLDSVEGIEAGMPWNIFLDTASKQERYSGAVVSIDGNVVTVTEKELPTAFTPSASPSYFGTFLVKGGSIGSHVVTDTAGEFSCHIEGRGNTGTLDAHAEGSQTAALGYSSHAEGRKTYAIGQVSHVEGYGGTAFGEGAHVEGAVCKATGGYSHAEGYYTEAEGRFTHSEGWETKTQGDAAHGEGYQTQASGHYAHAEGKQNIASGEGAHAEGWKNTVSGDAAHAEGKYNEASGEGAHAEGRSTVSSAYCSHAEGRGSVASDTGSHAEGRDTKASGSSSHTEGCRTEATGNNSHAEGDLTVAAGINAHAEGQQTNASGINSHAEGVGSAAKGVSSHAEGYYTEAEGRFTHTEGWETRTQGDAAHAEGYQTQASGHYAHAEGNQNIASGEGAHAEGWKNTVSGQAAHTEGKHNEASGQAAHAEGQQTNASGISSHAEGGGSAAKGVSSHAEGNWTIAGSDFQHVEGKYNVEDADGTYAHIVGNGKSSGARSNAYTLDWQGNGRYAGKVYAENEKELATREYVNDSVAEAGGGDMLRIVYDTDRTGIVDDAERLGGQLPEYYAKQADMDEKHIRNGSGTASIILFDKAALQYGPTMSPKAAGICALAAGMETNAPGYTATAFGCGSLANSDYAFAAGSYASAYGAASIALGYNVAAGNYQTVVGKYNIQHAGSTGFDDTSGSVFIVGGGSNKGYANAFRVTNDGNCYGQNTFAASGADYAEYFEWADGNPEGEDRRGYFVTLEGGKIRKATQADNYILGIVSATPVIEGNACTDQWQGMYQTDIFGNRLTETVEVPETTDERTGRVIPAHTETRFLLSPDYDASQKYLGRNERQEWSPVGIVGQLVVIDDGSCQENGFCTVAEDGTAVKSDTPTAYRVMERLDETHVRVFIK